MVNLDAATQIRLGYTCTISPRVAKASSASVVVAPVFPENTSIKMLFQVSITLVKFFTIIGGKFAPVFAAQKCLDHLG
jgi:hypothetical protein